MATTTTQAVLPQVGSPVLRPDGSFQEVWWRFFLTLLNRTGGTDGAGVAQLQAEITVLQNQTGDLFAGQEGQVVLAASIAALASAISQLQAQIEQQV